MTKAELETLRQSFPDAPTTQEVEDADKIMRFDSTVTMAMQALYMRVLETDMKGLSSEELISDLESDGFSRRVSELALKRLTTSRRLSGGIKKVSVPIQEIPGAKVMTVTVLKIALGVALVMLDGSFEARLESSNYDGPRELIKKGSSFRALCELYESSGELNVNIRQVVGLR
jgi:Fanconi anemia group M protein